MATLILSTVGTAIGGPLGGSIGAFIGSRFDQTIFKPGAREGSRLKELQVTSSTYGSPIPRHYGKIRSAGSIIWSTDLVESHEKHSGGKGQPSVTAYSYSASFAVALASRPIVGVGRIWADGVLLRGAEGDLKVGGNLRVYNGFGDQPPDPLMLAALGDHCPAFRGLAYCVFEDLQLAEYGNRFPALTFEIVADEGGVSLTEMVNSGTAVANVDRPLIDLVGYSDAGGSIAANLEAIDEVYPLTCDAAASQLSIRSADVTTVNPPLLPDAAADSSGDSFASLSGESRRRQADGGQVPEGVRYYDLSRDYQAGLQRADGRARPGRSRIIEFPGALDAETARKLANKAAERASSGSERISWRLPELDTTLTPGMAVRVPRRGGLWRIEEWEWRDNGVELQLLRLPHGTGRLQAADSGTINAPTDVTPTPTLLTAIELPWDGQGSGAERQVVAAASSVSAGWTGAMIYADKSGALEPLGATSRNRAVTGILALPLEPGEPSLISRSAVCEVDLASADFALLNTSIEGLVAGTNRAAIGREIVQFLRAERISETRWRLSGLLRGRGGTEAEAAQIRLAGASFVLLPEGVTYLDAAGLGDATQLAAVGLADTSPVSAPILGAGRTLVPLAPVHPRSSRSASGELHLNWVRRARGAWGWRDLVDVPLNEETERYTVGLGNPDQPALQWTVSEPRLTIPSAAIATMLAENTGQNLWVRQIGSRAASAPVLLHTL